MKTEHAVVLVPGFMLDRDLWTDIEHALEPFGSLIHPDPSLGDSIEEKARLALEAVEGTFSLIGFSMGGYVARQMVRMAPDRVSRLVLIATSARGDSELQLRRKSEAAGIQPGKFAGISRKSIRESLAPAHERNADLVERIHAMSLKLGGETFRRQAAIQRHDDTPGLSEIRCPTLIIAGQHDRLRSCEEASEMHASIEGSTLITLDAGHMIPLEAPRELARLLVEFLREPGMAT